MRCVATRAASFFRLKLRYLLVQALNLGARPASHEIVNTAVEQRGNADQNEELHLPF
jgi:hypothetical protein